MEKKELIIASPHGDIRKIKTLLEGGQAENWVYLGSDFLTLSTLERNLAGNSKCIDTVAIYKKVADDMRAEYVRWIDTLNRQHGKDIEWWFGAISSRNIYSCDLFQYACYLEILDRLLAEKGILPHVVFVESKGLAGDIRDWARRKNIPVLIKAGPFCQDAFRVRIKPALDWLKFIVVSIIRWLAAGESRIRAQGKKTLASGAVIIHTFVHDSTLSENGNVTERYLPLLHEYAAQKGFRTAVHPMLYGFQYSYRSIYARMRKSSIYFLIREDFLRLSDYLAVLTYPFRSLVRKIELEDIRSFNLSFSVEEVRSRECFSSAMNAVLTYRLFFRLHGVKFDPAFFVLWYENQIIDKALIAGVRRFFSQKKILGAQIFLHPPNYISLYPSQSEVDAHLSPDVLIETSAYQCQRACAFTNAIPCRIGAGLRYAHVFKKDNTVQSRQCEAITIMVVLPYNVVESIEILSLLSNTLNLIKHHVFILVKLHPDCSVQKIKERFGESRWPANFDIFNGSLAEAFKSASIVVSANSSSMVEAACYGIPVIYAGSRIMINQNILKDEVSEIIRECYTPSDLADAINAYCDISPHALSRYRELGNQVRDRYFTPVSDETLAPFFDEAINA